MITLKEIDKSYFELYDSVPMNVSVQSEYWIKRLDRGLGGLMLEEVPVEPYIKDLSIYERATEYEQNFDIANWRFYMAFDGESPVGAMTIVGMTKDPEADENEVLVVNEAENKGVRWWTFEEALKA